MIKIRLKGYLEALYPDGLELCAKTGREALHLLATFPGFRKEDGKKHMVRVDPLHYYTDFDLPLPAGSTLTLEPVLFGAGGGSARQIVIGALLIVAAFVVPGVEAWGLATLGDGGTVASILFNLGASLVIGGILQHLSKAPKADPTSGDKRSRFLSSTKNTVAAGTGIPLAYGRVKLGGHFLSFDVDAEDYVPE